MNADTTRLPRFSAAWRPRLFSGACAVLLCLLCLLSRGAPYAPGAALAACIPGTSVLLVPGPERSQIQTIFQALADAWQQHSGDAPSLRFLPGRGGNYAWGALPSEKSDGCAFAGVVLPSFLLLAQTRERMYAPEELTLCGLFASSPNALWVAEDSPFTSLALLLEHARAENEKPGGRFAVAGTGSYTDQHLATLQLDRAAGISSQYMPVLGSREAAQAVRDKSASACWAYALPEDGLPGMRPLAVAAEKRVAALPETPTFRESGLELLNAALFGLALSSTVPEEKRQEAGRLLDALLANAALRRAVDKAGLRFMPVDHARAAATLGAAEAEANALLEQFALIPPRDRRP